MKVTVKTYETKQMKLIYPEFHADDKKLAKRINSYIKTLSEVDQAFADEKKHTGERQFSIICDHISLVNNRVLSFRVQKGYQMMKKFNKTVNIDITTGRSIKLNEIIPDEKALFNVVKKKLDEDAEKKRKAKAKKGKKEPFAIEPMDNIGVQRSSNGKTVYDESGLKMIIGMFTIGEQGVILHFAATTIPSVLIKYSEYQKLFSPCIKDLINL